MAKESMRDKKKHYARERGMSSAQAQTGCLWNEHFFQPKVYNEMCSDPQCWKVKQQLLPTNCRHKNLLCLASLGERGLPTQISETGDKKSISSMSCPEFLLCLCFYILYSYNYEFVSQLKKIVKTNINKTYCFIVFCLTKDILLILRMIEFKEIKNRIFKL